MAGRKADMVFIQRIAMLIICWLSILFRLSEYYFLLFIGYTPGKIAILFSINIIRIER